MSLNIFHLKPQPLSQVVSHTLLDQMSRDRVCHHLVLRLFGSLEACSSCICSQGTTWHCLAASPASHPGVSKLLPPVGRMKGQEINGHLLLRVMDHKESRGHTQSGQCWLIMQATEGLRDISSTKGLNSRFRHCSSCWLQNKLMSLFVFEHWKISKTHSGRKLTNVSFVTSG